MNKLQPAANRRRPFRPLRLEELEARVVPDAAVIEDFAAGLAPYTTVLRFTPNAAVIPGAGHDGVTNALLKGDGFEWLVRADNTLAVQAGETVSAWIDLAGNADGRAYLGFAAKPNAVNDYLRTGGALSLVLAPNSNQLLLENNSGFRHATLAAVPMTYAADHWYRAEVVWGAGGAITGNLYDSDGVTLLTSVTGTAAAAPGSGIAFRGFGSDKYFDTVTEDDGSAGPAGRVHGAAVDPGHRPPHRLDQHLPPTGLLDPFEYQSVPGTGRDIWLGEFDQLAQYGLVNGVVGLAATNRSENHGNPSSYWGQMGWGPVVQGLDDPTETPLETPLLQQYVFRQLPGEATTLIGRSDVKHFFLATGVDGQQLRPGEADTYGSSLNADQDFYSPQQDVNPVTGEISNQALDYFGQNHAGGPRNADGLNQFQTHSYSSRIEHLLQVNVADLDPNQNPAGTRWFLAGNIFVPGDEDVTHTSRWVEIVPRFNGTTFSFSYPDGSGGQFNIRTIPGLTGIPPVVIAQTPAGTLTGPIHTVTITFSQPIDPSTFTPDKITGFTGPDGAIRVHRVTPVRGSNDTQFVVHFRSQGAAGTYAMTIGPDIADQDGNLMASPFRATFTIIAPSIIAQTPAGSTFAPVDTVQVTFNEPILPETFTPDKVTNFTGPNGAIPVDDVTPADGSNTRFLIHFAGQVTAGRYAMTVGPDIEDLSGNPMAAAFRATFTIVGPSIIAQTPDGGVLAPLDTVEVTFDEPIDPATFTPDKITSFMGPNGGIPVDDVTPADGSNTRFLIHFGSQSDNGTYTMVIGPDIQDQAGNSMAAAYTAVFTVVSSFGPDGFGYLGTANPYQDLELYQNGGIPMLFTTNNSYYGDDEYGTIDLGSDTFNFYGTTYTGANRLFVNSNGLITFGSGTTAYSNTNLTSSPTQAAIAPLWSDWVKTASDAGGQMILYRFDDLEGGGRQLIIEWNKIRHFGGNNTLVTFQVILTLDTGADAGDIVLNYPQITTGDANSEGRTATMGIKAAGTQGSFRLLGSFDAASPFVKTGQGVLISVPAAGPDTTAGLGVVTLPASPAFVNPVSPSDDASGGKTISGGSDPSAVDQAFCSSQPESPAFNPASAHPADLAGSAGLSDPLSETLGGIGPV